MMEWIIGVIVIVFLVNLFKPRRCDVCGIGFKRNYYTEDRRQKATPLSELQ